MVAVLARALEAYEAQRFWAQAHAVATALTPAERDAYGQEREAWEQGTARDEWERARG